MKSDKFICMPSAENALNMGLSIGDGNRDWNARGAEITLSDSDAIDPDRPLTGTPGLVLGARVAKSGSALAAP